MSGELLETGPKHAAATMNPLLDGFCVGITADRRWDEQAALFERRGASVLHGPTIRTLPLGGDDGLRRATDDVISRPPRFVIANTGIGMRSWFGAADAWGVDEALRRALAGAKIVARGPKASAAVHTAGLEVATRGTTERLAEAVDSVLADLEPGDRVAVQRDGGPRVPEFDRLRDAGAEVIEIPVYEWRIPEDRRPAVRLAEAVIGGRVHAVTFTAGPQVRNWFAIAAEADLDAPLGAALVQSDVVIGCVGDVCAEAAMDCGLPADRLVIPKAARLGPLVREVAEHLAARTAHVRVAGSDLVLAGTVATVAGRRVELTDTEARVLATLAARPGVVIAKRELLQVWGDPDGDPHLVEVAVGRLRRRLGSHGAAVASVPRRGYRLAV
jgi:uroporphyrinogen-III synthase